jgi:predicted DCC family thiol-disulfide oxidoreductase YuxK
MNQSTYILLYDDYCPLCTWYSGLFVKYGLLSKEQRQPFSTAGPSVLNSIDMDRGKDEIPLYDIATGQTRYGIDALLAILGQRWNWIERAGHWAPANWLLRKLYKLVSYNRKVIVARKCGPGAFDCSPALNMRYRILFLITCLLFNSLMLVPLHANLLARISFYHVTAGELQTAHLLFVLVNCCLAFSLGRSRGLEYLGQVNMLALVCILLLAGTWFLASLLALPELAIVINLAIVASIITREYFRRMGYAGILPAYKPVVFINAICVGVFLGYLFK